MLGLLILPGIVVYGYLLNLNYLYYVISTLALLTFPVIPVALVSGIVTLIMRFTKIIKNKDFVQYLTIVLTIFLIIAIQSLSGGPDDVWNLQLLSCLSTPALCLPVPIITAYYMI